MWPLSLLRIIKDPERILTDMAASEQKQKLTEHLHMPKTCGHKTPKGRTGVTHGIIKPGMVYKPPQQCDRYGR